MNTYMCMYSATELFMIILPQTKCVVNYCQMAKHVLGGRRGRDRMIVGFTTAYAISAYHR